MTLNDALLAYAATRLGLKVYEIEVILNIDFPYRLISLEVIQQWQNLSDNDRDFALKSVCDMAMEHYKYRAENILRTHNAILIKQNAVEKFADFDD